MLHRTTAPASLPKFSGSTTLDVVRTLGVELTVTSSGFMGMCPLPDHEDSTPSFHVYQRSDGGDRGWHCFGCGRGGDAEKLVMDMYRVTYSEALLALSGISPETHPQDALRMKLLRKAQVTYSLDEKLLVYLRINQMLYWIQATVPFEQWLGMCRQVDHLVREGESVDNTRALQDLLQQAFTLLPKVRT